MHIAMGIQRRVLGFLLVALLLGTAVGWQLHSGWQAALHGTHLAVLAALILCIWPLAWVATFRISRPVAELARVAGALREGSLQRRDELEPGDDEVGEVADALHVMADRLTDQLTEQRALMAAVSHELRSPLARVRVMVELVREGRAPEGLHDDLQAEVDGMDALVGDLLAGARIEFDALDPTPIAPAELARRALALAGLSAELLHGDGPAEVRADVTLLTRALRGLLDNGSRYGGRVVALVMDAPHGQVRFTVEDDGPGFADGEAEQGFQPFWRRPPEPGVEQPSGTGLGLALVRQIARAHGGDAGARNRPGGGAAVWLSVPGPPG